MKKYFLWAFTEESIPFVGYPDNTLFNLYVFML